MEGNLFNTDEVLSRWQILGNLEVDAGHACGEIIILEHEPGSFLRE